MFSNVDGPRVDEVWAVDDTGVEGLAAFESIKPGKSVTFKDGFSVESAYDIVHELASTDSRVERSTGR